VAIAPGVAGAALKVAGAQTSRSAAATIATANRTKFDLIRVSSLCFVHQ
jgi:hypothetical protein